jgi:hypothetical protein
MLLVARKAGQRETHAESSRVSMRTFLLPLTLVTMVSVYLPVVFTGRLSDDFHLLQIKTIGDVFSTQGGWSLRFLGNLAIYCDNLVYGNNLIGFHVTSVLLQCVNVLLFWLLAGRLTSGHPVSSLATAIYAFHFANAGSVSWLSDRWTLLSSTLVLASLFFWIRYFQNTRPVHLWLSVVAYTAALLTKESGVTALFIAIAYALIYRREPLSAAWARRVFGLALPFVAMTAAYALLRFTVFGGGAYPFQLSKLFLGPVFYGTYAFTPVDYFEFLSLLGIAPEGIKVLFAENVLMRVGVAAGVVLLGGSAVLLLKRFSSFHLSKLELFGLSWFAVSILHMAWFEIRWLNPATAGVALFYAGLLTRMFLHPRLFTAPTLAMLSALLFSSHLRVKSFEDADKLVRTVLDDTRTLEPSLPPHSLLVMVNLPDMQRNVHVFRHGVAEALRDVYADSTIRAVWNRTLGVRTRPLDAAEQLEFIQSQRSTMDAALHEGGKVVILQFDPVLGHVVRFQRGSR